MIKCEGYLRALEDYVVADTYVKREGWYALKRWAESVGFFEAPASHKYHLAEPGGLLVHSMGVYRFAMKLANVYEEETDVKFSRESITLCSIFHDISKLGTIVEESLGDWKLVPRYVRVRKGDSEGFIGVCDPNVIRTGYDYNKEYPEVNLGVQAVLIIKRFLELTYEEEQAIMLHDGPWVRGQENLYFKSGRLTHIMHCADWLAGITKEGKR